MFFTKNTFNIYFLKTSSMVFDYLSSIRSNWAYLLPVLLFKISNKIRSPIRASCVPVSIQKSECELLDKKSHELLLIYLFIRSDISNLSITKFEFSISKKTFWEIYRIQQLQYWKVGFLVFQ